jgi:hypothetical protein
MVAEVKRNLRGGVGRWAPFPPKSSGRGERHVLQKVDAFGRPNYGGKGKLFSMIP